MKGRYLHWRRLLELLVPHIQSALEIRQVAQQQLAGAETMADASATAAFLLSPLGEIRHFNQAAQSLLDAGDGLVQRIGILRAADARARESLQNLLKSMEPAASAFGMWLGRTAVSKNALRARSDGFW